jgi:hypothetical protein
MLDRELRDLASETPEEGPLGAHDRLGAPLGGGGERCREIFLTANLDWPQLDPELPRRCGHVPDDEILQPPG